MLLELVIGGKKDSAHGGKIQWHLWAVMPRADTILHIGVNRMRNTQSNVQLFEELGFHTFHAIMCSSLLERQWCQLES